MPAVRRSADVAAAGHRHRVPVLEPRDAPLPNLARRSSPRVSRRRGTPARRMRERHVQHWQEVSKPLRDTQLAKFVAPCYGLRGRTFRVSPHGVGHDQTKGRGGAVLRTGHELRGGGRRYGDPRLATEQSGRLLRGAGARRDQTAKRWTGPTRPVSARSDGGSRSAIGRCVAINERIRCGMAAPVSPRWATRWMVLASPSPRSLPRGRGKGADWLPPPSTKL